MGPLLIMAGLLTLLAHMGIFPRYLYFTGTLDGDSPPWYPTPRGGQLPSWQKSYQQAAEMVKKMELTEKVNVTTGIGWSQGLCVGNTAPAVNAGFPSLCLQDGPLGIRFADHATAWPAGITVGATWNRDLMYKRGRALGLEHRLKGINVMLGPSMGPLGRMPGGGRNWEGFGPDPVLAGVAAAETIKGIQEEGVIATAKHYIVNEQEHFRQSREWGTQTPISSYVDDRTMHELYLWPFADSVRAGVASVMCSYNLVNSSFACGNSLLLNGILKDELGFQGFVQSDWLAQRSGVASAMAGLDMSMPGDGEKWMDGKSFWGPKLTESVLNGSLPMDRLNDMVTRIVATWYHLGQDKWPSVEDGGGPNFSSWTDDELGKLHQGAKNDKTKVKVNKFFDVQGTGADFHGLLAREIAAEGTVLVKNEDDILPLNRKGWSDKEKPAKDDAKYFVTIFGEDAGPNPKGSNACPDRACNTGTLAQGGGSGSVEFPYLITPVEALKAAFDPKSVELTSVLSNKLPKNADPAIANNDLCIVFINSDAAEGYLHGKTITDRLDLYPQNDGDKLVQRVASKCPKVIVILHAVGPTLLERFIDLPAVKAVVLAHLPGQESGNALTDILFGDVNPSGRLPYTLGKSLDDYGPGGKIISKPTKPFHPQNEEFTEGLLIDYRHFDAASVTPRYEFGFGLSYTTFALSNFSLQELLPKFPLPGPRPEGLAPPNLPTDIPKWSACRFPPHFTKLKKYIYPYLPVYMNVPAGKEYDSYPHGYHETKEPSHAGGAEGGNPSLYDQHLSVSANITNTGPRTGKSVVQVYVSFPGPVTDDSVGPPSDTLRFPVRVLRGFEKVELEPGETKRVVVGLSRRDLSYWSRGRGNWVMPVEGRFTVWVGSSSRDLPLSGDW